MKKLFFLLLVTMLLSSCESVTNFFKKANNMVDTGYKANEPKEFKWTPPKEKLPPVKMGLEIKKDSI